MVFQNDILAGSSGGTGTSSAVHTIGQSIRFNDNDSAYMSKTFSASNRKTFTFSCWVKRGSLGSYQRIFNAYDSSDDEHLIFRDADVLHFYSGDASADVKTNQVFRDPSAWSHIVCAVDTTNAVSSERVRLYVNGSRVTSLATATYPSLNADTGFNENVAHHIGVSSATSQYFDGYLAEIVFIDGTALDPSSFGLYNDSNIWIPRDVSSLSFGTNGFHIKGENASDLGNDSSGNNNNFTTSGLASHDFCLDSPTNNFAVYNILYNVGDVDFPTYSEGNLSVDFNYFGKRSPVSTFALPTDSDAYCEFYIKTSAGSAHASGVGIGQGDANNAGNVALTNGITYNFNGYKHTGTGTATTFGNTYTAGDIIGVYFDLSDNEVDFYKNNTLEGSLSLSSYSGDLFFLVANNTTNQQVIIANFGQDDTFAGNKTSGSAGASDSSGNGKFYYTRISGAKALCSKSLGS